MNDSEDGVCSCGSGLRSIQCCKLDLTTAEKLVSPRLGRVMDNGRLEALRGNHAAAVKACLEVLEQAPGRVDALFLLYQLRRAAGTLDAAEVLLRRAVALDPNDFSILNELTLLLMAQARFSEAEGHARNAIRISPEHPQAHNLMGMVLTEQQRPQMGEYHYRRALMLHRGRDPVLLANLAWNLKTQGRIEESRTLYEESAAKLPEEVQTLLGWAQLEEVDRQFEAAWRLLDRAAVIAPDAPALRLSRAILLSRMDRHEEGISVLDDIGPGQIVSGAELLAKGRMLDRLQRQDEAFDAFAAGKQMAREQGDGVYLADQAALLVGRLRSFFSPSRVALLPRAQSRADVPQPIFVVGFPRSGTTLLEQMLSMHSSIAAGDELPLINEMAAMLPRMFDSPVAYPEALVELWMADHREGLDNLRDYYLQKARQLGATRIDRRWFTDKMPLNETHLGLIGLVFPDAPVLHMIRHPLDVVLSMFSNLLTHGFYCASSLQAAAQHYILIQDLVEHYLSAIKINYLRIRYEDLVTDQQQILEQVFTLIGEPLEVACLDFSSSRRYARTASYAQVAEKLYDRSRYRYRNYLRHLAPIIPILKPVIHRLGYSV